MNSKVWDSLFEMMDNDRGIGSIISIIVIVIIGFIDYGIYIGIDYLVKLVTLNETTLYYVHFSTIVILVIGSLWVTYIGYNYIKYNR